MIGIINKALINRVEWEGILAKEKPLTLKSMLSGHQTPQILSSKRNSTISHRLVPNTEISQKTTFANKN